MDLLTFAKYPFLKESSVYLKEHGPSPDELLGDLAYERVRILRKERVMEAQESGVIGGHPETIFIKAGSGWNNLKGCI